MLTHDPVCASHNITLLLRAQAAWTSATYSTTDLQLPFIYINLQLNTVPPILVSGTFSDDHTPIEDLATIAAGLLNVASEIGARRLRYVFLSWDFGLHGQPADNFTHLP
jgi:hypothetical protein